MSQSPPISAGSAPRSTPWMIWDLERVAWVVEARAREITDEEREIIRRSAERLLSAATRR